MANTVSDLCRILGTAFAVAELPEQRIRSVLFCGMRRSTFPRGKASFGGAMHRATALRGDNLAGLRVRW